MNYPPLPTFNYGWDILIVGGKTYLSLIHI